MREKLKFRYVIVKHPADYAIHEAFADRVTNDIIAINGEPVTLYGYAKEELVDIINMINTDIKSFSPIDGDCEHLYDAFDNIQWGNYEDTNTGYGKVLEFKKRNK